MRGEGGQGVTRLAPSPTGALHLGNARTFLINWALARRHGWRIVLRIEDLDGPRVKRGTDREAMDLLTWLGMDWDVGPSYQSADLGRYERALSQLGEAGLIYPCTCTRKDLASAQSAPHEEPGHDLRYPGTHRPEVPKPVVYRAEARGEGGDEAAGVELAWRLRTPDEAVAFEDVLHGPQAMNVWREVGDFVVASKAGLPAYQLAVVVDDAAQGVSDVVRGDDLLRSTPRQLLVYRMLGLGAGPRYWHLPLVVGEDGRRLAKRHGDTRLRRYHGEGVAAERVVGLIASWSGWGERTPMSAETFAAEFEIERLPRRAATFTAEDERWLVGG